MLSVLNFWPILINVDFLDWLSSISAISIFMEIRPVEAPVIYSVRRMDGRTDG